MRHLLSLLLGQLWLLSPLLLHLLGLLRLAWSPGLLTLMRQLWLPWLIAVMLLRLELCALLGQLPNHSAEAALEAHERGTRSIEGPLLSEKRAMTSSF